ncbi:MAG: 23S rRNA (adenine(2030)-N(6))-methyltransferase RlmJ [Gammaproteobacteria bacterium]
MNYRHAFHAGNFADIVKHTVLAVLLEALNRKPVPWSYFDSHAGAGVYDLAAEAATKSNESAGGIGRLWVGRRAAPAPVMQLCDAVATVNPGLAPGVTPRFYPGSPMVAAGLARAQDRLVLAELQPHEERVLHDRFRRDPRVAIHLRDGYEMLKALLPPAERRGLVLMDPPFEQPEEFSRMLDTLRVAHARWSMGTYALWYPMKDVPAVMRFERGLLQSDIRRILLAEFRMAPAEVPGFFGCGMAVVNPPWQSESSLDNALSFLKDVLAPKTGSHDIRWLVRE